jgi:hypothetical protein
MTEEEIWDIIPVHDLKSGKPFPDRRLTDEPPGMSSRERA